MRRRPRRPHAGTPRSNDTKNVQRCEWARWVLPPVVDGRWLAFSSDRNTPGRGHDNGKGWEHTQELNIYVKRPDGREFRRIASKPDHCLGTPKWSPDGKRLVFYDMTTETTWGARRPNIVSGVVSQIVSVDATSGERIEHTSGPGLKVFPQFLSTSEIAYQRKGGNDEGRYLEEFCAFSVMISLPSRVKTGNTLAGAFNPTVSPDGQLVAFGVGASQAKRV